MILKDLLLFSYRKTLLRKIREASAEPLLSRQLVPQVAITMVAGGLKELKELKEHRGSYLKSVKEVPGLNSVIINFPISNYCRRHSKMN